MRVRVWLNGTPRMAYTSMLGKIKPFTGGVTYQTLVGDQEVPPLSVQEFRSRRQGIARPRIHILTSKWS
jgi:hypothetical protein